MMDSNRDHAEAVKREAQDWLVHMTSGEATTDDLRALRDWRAQSPLHADAFARACRFWKTLRPAVEVVARDGGAGLRSLTPGKRTMTRRGFLIGGAATAAAAATVVVIHPPFGLSLSNLTADYRTGTGEQRRLAAGDGVSVEMNTETSLNLPPSDYGRKIELIRGEAVITAGVSPQEPVTVIASQGLIVASDATFNVRCTDGATTQITCLAGSVQVQYRERTTTVGQHQQFSYDDRAAEMAVTVDPAIVTAWRQGQLVFHNEPLDRVIAEVNRYRRGRIVVTNSALGKHLVTARFKLDRLDDVVDQVRQVFGAQVRSLPGDIVLLS